MYGGRFCHIRKESCSQVKVCINYIENTIIIVIIIFPLPQLSLVYGLSDINIYIPQPCISNEKSTNVTTNLGKMLAV